MKISKTLPDTVKRNIFSLISSTDGVIDFVHILPIILYTTLYCIHIYMGQPVPFPIVDCVTKILQVIVVIFVNTSLIHSPNNIATTVKSSVLISVDLLLPRNISCLTVTQLIFYPGREDCQDLIFSLETLTWQQRGQESRQGVSRGTPLLQILQR